MGLFKKKQPTTAVPNLNDERLDRSAIEEVLAIVEAERDQAQARAAAEFGLDRIEEWSMDLGAGTASFVTATGRWTGDIEVLGSLNAGANSWMWGWANEKISDDLTQASFQIYKLGKSQSIPSLTTITLAADERDADSLAALVFGYCASQFLFKTPTEPSFYLAVRDIRAL